MKRIRTEPHDGGAEGDERIRTAVCEPSTDAAYEKPTAATESDADFLARLEAVGRDYRFSDEFIGMVVRRRFPCQYPDARGGAR